MLLPFFPGFVGVPVGFSASLGADCWWAFLLPPISLGPFLVRTSGIVKKLFVKLTKGQPRKVLQRRGVGCSA